MKRGGNPTSSILSLCIQLKLPPLTYSEWLKRGGGGQMSYKGKRSSMSGNMCILWRCTIFVQTYCVVWQKRNADILLSVQGKCNLPLRGRCTNPLEKTSWGLREEKRGQYGPKDNPPPTLPPDPQWMQQHKSLWHLRKLIFANRSVPDATLWCWSRW